MKMKLTDEERKTGWMVGTWREVAEKEGYYGGTGWAIEDVQGYWKDNGHPDLSDEEALSILLGLESGLQDSAVESGWDVMSYGLSEWEHAQSLESLKP